MHLHHNALLPMLYHTYSSGMAHDRLDVMVDSFLFTQPLEETQLNVWFDSSAELTAYADHRGQRGMKHVRLWDFTIHADKVRLQLEQAVLYLHRVGPISWRCGHEVTMPGQEALQAFVSHFAVKYSMYQGRTAYRCFWTRH